MNYWTVTGDNIENLKTELSTDFVERHDSRMARGKLWKLIFNRHEDLYYKMPKGRKYAGTSNKISLST